MQRRFRDWQSRLAAIFDERSKDAFEWGRNDCGLFAADCALAITGVDPAEGIRGHYKTKAGGMRLIKDGLEQFADKSFTRLESPLSAGIGDIGIVNVAETGLDAFVVCGGSSWYGPAANGLAQYKRSDVKIAWSVGK